MTRKEFIKEIKELVLAGNESGIYYNEYAKEHIESFIKKGYFLIGRFGRETTYLFSRKLIKDVQGRKK